MLLPIDVTVRWPTTGSMHAFVENLRKSSAVLSSFIPGFRRWAMIASRIFIPLMILLATATAAEPRAPWKLTTTERIRLRRDPNLAAERRRTPALIDMNVASSADVISGKDHPELFLPTELLTFLITSVARDAATSSRTKRDLDPLLQTFGWDASSFWSDIDRVAAAYIASGNGIDVEGVERDRRMCSARAAALADLRGRYKRFDEFLYVGIAPTRTIIEEVSRSADWLLWIEGGCQ